MSKSSAGFLESPVGTVATSAVGSTTSWPLAGRARHAGDQHPPVGRNGHCEAPERNAGRERTRSGDTA